MDNVCAARWRLRGESGSGRARADYLAGYGEALADRAAERKPERLIEE
jgi:hypothetical protein